MDIDTASMPPGSTERHQFEEMLVSDIERILNLGAHDQVEIVRLKPAPGTKWLTVVEFDIHPGDNEENSEEYEALDEILEEKRRDILSRFHGMLQDTFSPLYTGFVTCKLDPTFSMNFPHDSAGEVTTIFSSDHSIMDIMNKYKDIALPDRFMDASHFVIYISWEGKNANKNHCHHRGYPFHF